MTDDALRDAVLTRLRRGDATLAQLRAALPADHAYARALMSMGEEDPFGAVLTALVVEGAVTESDGRYRLP